MSAGKAGAQAALAVVDMGWGDSGKGAVTAGLTLLHNAVLNVRFSGGCQAAHNVIHNGVHHCFAQFGSGSLIPGVRTHLSRFMLIEPYAHINEAQILSSKGVTDIFSRLTIDPWAVITTPWHRMANQIREICRGIKLHGSTGRGIGECRSQELRGLALRVEDLLDRNYASMTLNDIRRVSILSLPDYIPAEAQSLYQEMHDESVDDTLDFYRDWSRLFQHCHIPVIDGPVIFEGSQGVMLDETYGTPPYNTWTDCTFNNAMTLSQEWDIDRPTKVGVLRTYSTRHGAGPFVTEDPSMQFPDHNEYGQWQGNFRQGSLDLVAARYAVRASVPDCLAITHMDCVLPQWKYCKQYMGDIDMLNAERLAKARPVLSETDNILATINEQLELPIRYTTNGPATDNFYTSMTVHSNR